MTTVRIPQAMQVYTLDKDVVALPKLLRPWFRHDRTRLGTLCQLVARLLHQAYQALDPRGKPGFIL